MDGPPGLDRPRRRFPWVNAGLFLATLVTTTIAGAGAAPAEEGQVGVLGLLAAGLPFSASMVGILLCHELGHYLMGRAYGVSSTLPFFIPGPPPVGTFGALIRIRSPMPSRRAVADIGAAGPLAGLAVCLPLLFWGFAHSEVRPLPGITFANTGSLFEIARALLDGEKLVWDGPVWAFGDNFFTWLAQRLTVGVPPPGHDVFLHPVGLAAWFGLLVTALNLFPLGQLDGGHVLYAWLGRRSARGVSRAVSYALLALGVFVSLNWLGWWLVTRVVGVGHPPALVEEPLDPGRRALAVASLLLFAATFIPVPIRFGS